MNTNAVFDELLELEPVKKLFDECFEELDKSKVWGWGENAKETITRNVSSLLSFCQKCLNGFSMGNSQLENTNKETIFYEMDIKVKQYQTGIS